MKLFNQGCGEEKFFEREGDIYKIFKSWAGAKPYFSI